MLILLTILIIAQQTSEEIMQTATVRHTEHYSYFHRGRTEDARPETRGGFALVGGGADVDQAFHWMADRGGKGDFLVLRGSGGDGYQEYLDQLLSPNSVQTLVLKTPEAAHDPFVLERIAQAEAIFLAGGDQWNYVDKWRDTPLLDSLNAALLQGVPLGGTSAGLAVLGEHIFTAEKSTVTSAEALRDPYHPAITLESHFLDAPPLRGLITDSHFSERERMGRLVTFMARLHGDKELESVRGVGVDESTAVLLESDGSSQVVGKGSAHFVSSNTSPETCRPSEPLTFTGMTVHSVSHGESFDLSTWSSEQVQPKTLSVRNGVLLEEEAIAP